MTPRPRQGDAAVSLAQVRSLERRVPPLPPRPQTPGSQGAWAPESGARWQRQQSASLVPPSEDQADPAGLLPKRSQRHTRPPGSPLPSPRGPPCNPTPASRASSLLGAVHRSPPRAPHSYPPPRARCWGYRLFWLFLLRLVLFSASPRARFASKSGGWRREKKKPVLKGAARTDLSAAEEDPWSGRALLPAGALERRARAER